MNYLLFLLALNPEIQSKMVEEIDSVFESVGDDEESFEVTMTHLTQLKYTEQCIKEALRLYPPVAGWMRRNTKDVELGKDMEFAKRR